VYASGLVIRDLPHVASSWRKTQSLPDFLLDQRVVAIADIDTRKLTRILREKGAQPGCIMAGRLDTNEAVVHARSFPGLAGMDLAKTVTCQNAYTWDAGEWVLGTGYQSPGLPDSKRFHVVAFDFG